MRLSQTDFGRLGGVGKGTQINYETGKTSPDAAYLIALMAHGVDAVYILTGRRSVGDAESLLADEAELLGYYRACDRENRTAAVVVLKGLARNSSLGGPSRPPQAMADTLHDEAAERYASHLPEPGMMQRQTMRGTARGGKR